MEALKYVLTVGKFHKDESPLVIISVLIELFYLAFNVSHESCLLSVFLLSVFDDLALAFDSVGI